MFNQLARYYDMDEINLNLDAITLNRESWTKKLEKALGEFVEAAEDMMDDFKDALGSEEVKALKVSIKDAEKKFALLINKLWRLKPNEYEYFSPASLRPVQSNYEDKLNAQVNIAIDADITGKESEDEDATDEEEADFTHHTSTAESSNVDENKAEVMDQGTIGNAKIIQSSFCDKGVGKERTLFTEEVKDVFDKIPEDLKKDVFDDISERVADNERSTEVDDNDKDATEVEVIKEARVALLADTPKLESRFYFREDLKAATEILNIHIDDTVTNDELEKNDVCLEVTDKDVLNDPAYWYKKVQNNEAEATAIISSNTLFDPGPNDLMVKESPELKPDGVVYFKKRETDVTSRQVIRNKDRAGIRVVVMIYNCGDNFARLTDGTVNDESNYFVHDMTVVEDMMGVNLASKVDTEFEQLEFPNIFEKYLLDDEESDVPIKSNLVFEKDELYDVITSLETDFNLD